MSVGDEATPAASEELRVPGPELPRGVTPEAWEWERESHQNPRLRVLIGCLDLFASIEESDFTLLHCSPHRLGPVREGLLRIRRALRRDLAPHLAAESVVPALEAVRREVRDAVQVLDGAVLGPLDAWGEEVPAERLGELRHGLCRSLHELGPFLRESFGRIVAADPRSRHDVDYFVSRRFARDLVDAETLQDAIQVLVDELVPLATHRRQGLLEVADRMCDGGLRSAAEPPETSWLLEQVEAEVVPRLRTLVSLPGVRVDELRLLGGWADRLPVQTGVAARLLGIGRDLALLEASEGSSDPKGELRRALGREIADLLRDIDHGLHELELFLRHWLAAVGSRRALRLRSGEGPGEA